MCSEKPAQNVGSGPGGTRWHVKLPLAGQRTCSLLGLLRPGRRAATLNDLLEQLLERLQREHMPVELAFTCQDRLNISCSIGGATADPSETFEEIVQRADRAMYAQKPPSVRDSDEVSE